MYGTHHKTGKQIRLLQNSTSTWRDKKTLVWLNSSDDMNVSWNRFDIGCVGSKHVENVKADVAVCLDNEDVQWIREKGFEKVRLIFASKKVLDQVGLEFFEEHKINNILCLDELHLLYTFIETPWDDSENDACILVALTLRFGFTYPVQPTTRNTMNLKVSSNLVKPQTLYYITQYYVPEQSKRRNEINTCLHNNVENTYIDHIILLNEKDFSAKLPKSCKLKQEIINHRLHYDDVVRYINDNIPEDSIVVFANADIYLDESIRSIWSTNVEDKFFALLRYDDDENGNSEIFGPRADSQDTWILSSNSVKNRNWKYEDFHFSFGISGCDNAITTEMLRMKFLVVNPALTIKTHHLHISEIRTYNKDDIIDKSVFLYIEPTGLQDMEPVVQLPSNKIDSKLELGAFDREIISSNANKVATYCKMIEKQKRYEYSSSGKNTFAQRYVPLYYFENIFQTNSGLVYDYDRIYVGASKIATEYWSKSNLSTLTPSIKVKKAYIAPLPNNISNSVENYILYYFGKILMMREKYGNDGEFWCPNKKEFVQMLTLFNWQTKNVPVISQTENPLAFVQRSYVWFPNDNLEVSSEEMNALRNFIKNENNVSSKILVYMDEEYVNKLFMKELESKYENVEVLFAQTSVERKIQMLQCAKVLITLGSDSTESIWKYVWAMNPSSTVIDIQNEMAMNGEIHHIVSASSLKHVLHVVPKGSLTPVLRTRIIDSLKTVFLGTGLSSFASENSIGDTQTKSDLPIIYVPHNDTKGFFGHKGDSFREMIDLWVERGYVRKEYGSNKNVWLNNVGDTLLYDRPNYDWIKQATGNEQSWKKALFGNPKPIGNNAKSWSFWARRPRLVEAMLDKQVEKTKNVVFYGKIENQVQRSNRTKYDWSSVCDASEYYLAKENESPKYSEQEYLNKLAEARYGLCLAGYGKKCHREVECMAFGTVPLVAEEVDINNYANPPIEGLHYIRVSSPDEVTKKLSEIDDDVWWRMSQACKKWYKENCSVDGMWGLTKQLLV
uniref:Exostosin GT47 domain-containing protein n=1 Tax=viral metagenome TaxID=1070528 RepID=A0A6C0D8I3_9ZZZZ